MFKIEYQHINGLDLPHYLIAATEENIRQNLKSIENEIAECNGTLAFNFIDTDGNYQVKYSREISNALVDKANQLL